MRRAGEKKTEQSTKAMRHWRKNKKSKGKRREATKSERSGQRNSSCKNREGGLRWAWAEGCEVQGSLQSKQRLTEGLLSVSGWARGGDSNTGM